MPDLARRSVLLGSIAITITASGLAIPAYARASWLGGVFHSIGAGVASAVHSVTHIVQGAGSIVQQVAPELIHGAITTAAQFAGAAIPAISEMEGLVSDTVGILTNQTVQQVGVFCNAGIQDFNMSGLANLARTPLPVDATQQQLVNTNPGRFLADNLQTVLNHIFQYIPDGNPFTYMAAAGLSSDSGVTPTFTPFGVPYQGNTNGNGIFPAILALNSADLAMGGDGLLSLLALL